MSKQKCKDCSDYDDISEACASVDGEFCGADKDPDEIACDDFNQKIFIFIKE